MNRLVLSPYDLTARNPAAMAVLLLAETAVTYLPVPLSGETRAELAASLAHSPRYRRLLVNWLALAPLFSAGAVHTLHHAEDPAAAVRRSASRLGSDPAWAGLAAAVRSDAFDDDDRVLDDVSADMLKGGPDPGIALPIGAGLDSFAATQGLPVARIGHAEVVGAHGSRGSLAQQFENRMGQPLGSFGVPVLLQANAGTLMYARSALAHERTRLQDAVAAMVHDPTGKSAQGVRQSASAFAAAFRATMGSLLNLDDESGKRIVPGYVSIVVKRVPVDAVLLSSLAALRASAGGRSGAVAVAPQPPSLVTLTVTPLDVQGLDQ